MCGPSGTHPWTYVSEYWASKRGPGVRLHLAHAPMICNLRYKASTGAGADLAAGSAKCASVQ